MGCKKNNRTRRGIGERQGVHDLAINSKEKDGDLTLNQIGISLSCFVSLCLSFVVPACSIAFFFLLCRTTNRPFLRIRMLDTEGMASISWRFRMRHFLSCFSLSLSLHLFAYFFSSHFAILITCFASRDKETTSRQTTKTKTTENRAHVKNVFLLLTTVEKENCPQLTESIVQHLGEAVI